MMRFALAVLHAEMRMRSSMSRSFGSLNGAGVGLDGLVGRELRSVARASGGKGVPGRDSSGLPSWP